MSRVYVGRVPYRAEERDLEDFFRGFGKIREIVLKNGFGFVQFDDPRDADDAVHEMDGRTMLGTPVSVELCHSRGRSYRDGGRYGAPVKTEYRLSVENLSTRCSWQDLKDLMRGAGDVTFADAHKEERHHGVVCFSSHEDLKRAIDKYQGKEINGRALKLHDESRGRSRSRSPRSRDRSRSPRPRDRSRDRSRGRDRSRSGSRSPAAKRASRSRSPAAKRRSRSSSSSS